MPYCYGSGGGYDQFTERREQPLYVVPEVKPEPELKNPHYTDARYREGCRCRLCKAAHSSALRRQRTEARRAKITGDESWHGTYYGYDKQGCRCIRCKAARAEYQNEWRDRRMRKGENTHERDA